MNNLCLEIRPTCGANLNDCMKDACELAAKLGLHHVGFEFNGENIACYGDGTAQRVSGPTGREMWDGFKWTHIKPIITELAVPLPESHQ